MVALLHLHGVAQGAGGSGDDGDFLNRGGVGLQGGHQSMADFMVGNGHLFLVCQDGVLLLVACNDHLNGFLQIGLGDHRPVVPDGSQSGLVDDVCQLRAGSAGGHSCHGFKVHIVGNLYLFGVNLQNFLPAVQIRQLHGNPAVKPAGTGQGRVKGLGAVGGGQNNHAAVVLKAVHLRQQLVQGLLPFVVAPHAAGVSLLANGVNLVNEHDAGSLLLGLLEEVSDLAGAHAHEHLHKFRAAHGEEGDIGFAGHGLCQHGFAGARRANQQHALGHGGADFRVFAGVVEVIYDFSQAFLRLVHALHIGKADAVGGFHIHLGVGFVEGQGIGAAHFIHHLPGQELPDGGEHHQRQNPGQHEAEEGRGFLNDFAGELRPGGVEPIGAAGILHQAGFENFILLFIGENNLVFLHIHPADILVFGHGHEGAVVHLLNLPLQKPGHGQRVEQRQNQHHHQIVENQRLFRLFHFIHRKSSSLSSSID